MEKSLFKFNKKSIFLKNAINTPLWLAAKKINEGGGIYDELNGN